MERIKQRLILHPFFFGLFPIFSLFSANRARSSWSDLTLPIGVTLFAVALLFLSAALALKDSRKAALVSSLFFVLFFLFGHVLEQLSTWAPRASGILIEIILLLIWSLGLATACYFVHRTRAPLERLTRVLDVTGGAALAIPLLLNILQPKLPPTYGPESFVAAPTGNRANLPDIYYIVLDAYGRADTLRDIYHYDNAPFLDRLEELGFYVARESRANYTQTYLTLASSLNATYLDDYLDYSAAPGSTRDPVLSLIPENRVARFLGGHGYTFVSFASGYGPSEMTEADLYLEPRFSLREFHNVLLGTTPIPSIFRIVRSGWDPRYTFHRERILYVFDTLPTIAGRAEPTFTFAHILAPHPPFVFDPEGNPVQPNRPWSLDDGSEFFARGGSREEYIEGYRGQIAYVNTKVLETVEDILDRSSSPPIIILQGDHGPGLNLDWDSLENTNLDERLGILNAFYFPTEDYASLPADISPVNTFAVILNQFFSTDYELLDYRQFYSKWDPARNVTEIAEVFDRQAAD